MAQKDKGRSPNITNPHNNQTKQIENEIHALLLQQPIDLAQLRAYSRKPGGYQTNQLRARVWPKLLGINRFTLVDYRNYVIRPNKDENQINADVERSLWTHEPMKFWKESHRERRRQVLAEMMMAIVSKNKHLHYYQGYHDLVTTILTVVEDDPLSFAIIEHLSLFYVSDYMRENFELVSKFLQFLFVLIQSQDEELYEHLQKARMEPFFAISWLITWFSHDVKDVDILARVFDALIASPPIFCFYVCAVYVIHLRDFILKAEADFAIIHDVLIKSPHKYGFPFEIVLEKADELYKKLPFTSVLPLCDKDLFRVITCNRILLFEKPKSQLNFVDSDWKLLENLKLQKWDSLHYWKYSLQTSLNWLSSVFPKNRLEDNATVEEQIRINDKEEDSSNTVTPSKRSKRRKSVTLKKGKGSTNNTSSSTPRRRPSISPMKKRRKSMRGFSVPFFNFFSPFSEDSDSSFFHDESTATNTTKNSLLSINKLFWYITVVVSSVLGYYIITYRIENFQTTLWKVLTNRH